MWESGGKVSSVSGRRQRPVTRTGWDRTCGKAKIGVRSPTTQMMLGENGSLGSIIFPVRGEP